MNIPFDIIDKVFGLARKKIDDNVYLNIFYDKTIAKTDYIPNEKKTLFQDELSTLFSQDNAKKLKRLARKTSVYDIEKTVEQFLYDEMNTVCETSYTKYALKQHVMSYLKLVIDEIKHKNPKKYMPIFLSKMMNAIGDLSIQVEESTDNIKNHVTTELDRAINTINSNKEDGKKKEEKETISLSKASNDTQAEMKESFHKPIFFEEDLKSNIGDEYTPVQLSTVYQIPDCVYYDCGNRELKEIINDDKEVFFRDKFWNYDTSNSSVMKEVDEFYNSCSMNIVSTIKMFLAAKNYKDYKSNQLIRSTDEVPTICYIYGEAGIGKTTLTSCMCNDYSGLTDNKVYLIKLRDIDIINGVPYFHDKEINFSELHDGLVLWLDGLDESVHKESECTVLNIIKRKIGSKNVKIIITSRMGYGQIEKDCLVLKICPFDSDKIKTYIDTYYGQNHILKEHGYKKIADIVADIGGLYKNYRILTVPMILQMFIFNTTIKSICNIVDGDKRDKYTEMHLYDDLLGKDSCILVNKIYDDNVQLAKEEEIKQYREEAKNISFEMFRQNSLCITVNDNMDNKVFDFYINRIEGERQGKYKVEFLHKSFYEYFIAEKLLDQVLESVTKGQDFKRLLNEAFGVNRIDKYIIRFIEFIIDNKKIGLELKLVKEQLKKSFIDFTKDFCIGAHYYENKDYFMENLMQHVACNTFANVTAILLKICKNKDHAIDIFDIKYLGDTLRQNIEDLLTVNNHNVNFENIVLGYSHESVSNVYRNVCLSGSNLAGADLEKVMLVRSNLVNANLEGANLRGADLWSSIMSQAKLNNVNFINADLTRVDLESTYIERANFIGADLSGAFLRGAHFHNCTLTPDQREYIIANGGIVD